MTTFRWSANPILAALSHRPEPPAEDHILAAALHDRHPFGLPWESMPRWYRIPQARAAACLHPALVAAGWTPPAPPRSRPLLPAPEQRGEA